MTLLDGQRQAAAGATWYKVVSGTRVEESDILDVAERTQAQIEFVAGSHRQSGRTRVLSISPRPRRRAAPIALVVPLGWVKAVAKPPGLQAPHGVVQRHGRRRDRRDARDEDRRGVLRRARRRADGRSRGERRRRPAHDLKRGEYWAKAATGAVTTVSRAPRNFVDKMPRHFIDQLHAFAGRLKSPPPLVVDHEIDFGEAEPWLAGRDRAVFERRFTSRLRDPAFRSAVHAECRTLSDLGSNPQSGEVRAQEDARTRSSPRRRPRSEAPARGQ